jgi:arginyl-tRNA synthetase
METRLAAHPAAAPQDSAPGSLTSQVEERLLATLAAFPAEVQRAAQTLDPTGLVRFAGRLVADFNAFDREGTAAREPSAAPGAAVTGCRVVLLNLLRLLGIAPGPAASLSPSG